MEETLAYMKSIGVKPLRNEAVSVPEGFPKEESFDLIGIDDVTGHIFAEGEEERK